MNALILSDPKLFEPLRDNPLVANTKSSLIALQDNPGRPELLDEVQSTNNTGKDISSGDLSIGSAPTQQKKRGRPPKKRQEEQNNNEDTYAEIAGNVESQKACEALQEEIEQIKKDDNGQSKANGSRKEDSEQKEAEDRSGPGLRHIGFMLKAAHSLSKYHTMHPLKVRKLTIKYLKQKEKRIKDALKFFLKASLLKPEN
jgi:hypothetical protein